MKDLQQSNGINTEHFKPCLAYESAELAAMCSDDLLWNIRRRTEVLRETLILPADAGLHAMAPSALCEPFDAQSMSSAPLVDYMVKHNLLTLWVPSQYAVSQHVVFINACHAAFASIAVLRRQLVLTRPSWSGRVYSPDRVILVAGAQINEPPARFGAIQRRLLASILWEGENASV